MIRAILAGLDIPVAALFVLLFGLRDDQPPRGFRGAALAAGLALSTAWRFI